jgi:hypothetical protein
MSRLTAVQNNKTSKTVAVVLSILCVCAALFVIRSFLRGGTPSSVLYDTFICSETGKTFEHKLRLDEEIPVLSPYSGKNTGVPAEPCYWTAEGGTKDEPTWVLLNELCGKPGPTFCPDCGRLVVHRNPPPGSVAHPPPTQEEYAARHVRREAESSSNER